MRGDGKIAMQIFPWNNFFRTRPGYVAIMSQGPVEDIKLALRGDPFSADLTFNLGVRYTLDGDSEAADTIFARFHKIAPKSSLVKGPTQ